jgi:hypothetical protein
MELGSFRTLTVLFIMILPQRVGLKKLVEHQCGMKPDTGAEHFLINLISVNQYLSAGR